MGQKNQLSRLLSRPPGDVGCVSSSQDTGVNAGFTLIELMAVVVVIALLSAIAFGVTSFVKRKLAINMTRSQIAAMEAALESYKSDWGHYPVTLLGRISSSGGMEASNNWYLYRALSGAASGKRYMAFPTTMIQTNSTILTGNSNFLANIFDPFGAPYNYYCSPGTAFALSNNFYGYPTNVNAGNGYAAGGQVNVASFDLFSYGPDRLTFVATNLAYGYWGDGPWVNAGWKNPAAANDDITSWTK